MKNEKLKIRGFTLVELLIVIALIGILSVAVLSTINPIEQANKARDAKYKNDAAEILNALERYYASQQKYVWNKVDDSLTSKPFGGNANRIGVGICGGTGTSTDAGDCTASGTDGELIATDELKKAFKGKDFLTAVAADKKMYVYKAADSGTTASSVYVCFVPAAKANRTDLTKLKSFTTVSDTDVSGMAECTTAPDWATTFCYMCVPE
jgi:prepilin-type N-terminal cleavage/methylation domain-containing protein